MKVNGKQIFELFEKILPDRDKGFFFCYENVRTTAYIKVPYLETSKSDTFDLVFYHRNGCTSREVLTITLNLNKYYEFDYSCGTHICMSNYQEHNPRGAGRKESISYEIRAKIRDEYAQGATMKYLSKTYGIGLGSVSRIIKEV